MHIRTLHRADAATLQACRLFALQESPEAFLSAYADVKDTPIAAVEADLDNAHMHYLGAFDGDALVGFMRSVRDARASRRHVAEVRSVYVRRSHRGRRIARQLMERIIADAASDGVESLILSVLADNAAARALYAAVGFVSYGTEPRAIKVGARYVDQVHYVLALAPR